MQIRRSNARALLSAGVSVIALACACAATAGAARGAELKLLGKAWSEYNRTAPGPSSNETPLVLLEGLSVDGQTIMGSSYRPYQECYTIPTTVGGSTTNCYTNYTPEIRVFDATGSRALTPPLPTSFVNDQVNRVTIEKSFTYYGGNVFAGAPLYIYEDYRSYWGTYDPATGTTTPGSYESTNTPYVLAASGWTKVDVGAAPGAGYVSGGVTDAGEIVWRKPGTATSPEEYVLVKDGARTGVYRLPAGVLGEGAEGPRTIRSIKGSTTSATGPVALTVADSRLEYSANPYFTTQTVPYANTMEAYVLFADGSNRALPVKMVYSDITTTAKAVDAYGVTDRGNAVVGVATQGDPTQPGATFRAYRHKIGSDQLDMIPGSTIAAGAGLDMRNTSQLASAWNRDATVVAGSAVRLERSNTNCTTTGCTTNVAPISALTVGTDFAEELWSFRARAWIYDEVKGTRLAADVFRANGVDVPTTTDVAYISAMTPDGSTMIGSLSSDPTNRMALDAFKVSGLAHHRWLGAGGYAPQQTVAAGKTARVGILGGDASGVMTVEAGGLLKLGETLDSTSTDANARSIWGGALTGAGAAIFSGKKWIVAAANTISGGFTVAGGDVELRGGSFSGPVAIDAAGTVSGSGSLGAVSGTGAIALRNADDRIAVGAGDATSIFDGAVIGPGALEKVGAGTFTFTNQASGAQGVVKSGVFNLLGDWTGAMRVEGGALTGSGKVDALTVAAGGAHVVSLGQTMTVRGDYTLGAGSTFAPALDANGTSGKVSVQGKIVIDGATLDARQATGDFAGRKYAYTLIENKGGQAVSGAFGSVAWGLPYLTPKVTTDSDVVLTLERRTLTPTDPSAVETALATSLDKLAQSNDPATQAIIAELAYTTSSAELRRRLAQISGAAEAGVTARTALGAATVIGDLVGDVMVNPGAAAWSGSAPAYVQPNAYLPAMADLPSARAIRAAVAPPAAAPTWGVWGKAIGAYTKAGAGAGGVASTSRLAGAVFGLDGQIAPWLRVGVAGGWRGDRLSARSGFESKQSGGFGAVYAHAAFGATYLNGAVALGQNSVDTTRRIAFGAVVTSPTGKYNARDVQARLEAGHSLALGSFSAQPYVGLRYVRLRADAYTETNSPLALSVRARTVQAWDALAGVRLSTIVNLGSLTVAPQLRVGVVEALGPVRGGAVMALAGLSPYAVTTQFRDRTAATAGLGLNVSISPHVQAFADYDLQASRRIVSHQGQAGLRMKF